MGCIALTKSFTHEDTLLAFGVLVEDIKICLMNWKTGQYPAGWLTGGALASY